ncbi:formylglycine-generating enzyme family protein [Streptomyces sp. NPDC059629]|uniref:formylglycine-generating enzyme family protein n=1 Tax=Streptomyces sp. NPDC059629 TaxID=3346889 RepID=UPI0036C92AD2
MESIRPPSACCAPAAPADHSIRPLPYNTSGNVWECCADRWRTEHGTDAAGPARVIRGGSQLCHASYCNRYRVAARTADTPDSSTGHTGFRCVQDAG